MNKENEEHVVSEREKRAWQKNKNRTSGHVRPELDRLQRIEFLELVASLSSASTLERKLGLSGADTAYYMKELDVESPDEARRLARKLKRQSDDEREATAVEELRKAREAEQVAQARLEELEARRAATTGDRPKVDIDKIRKEDAERQRRFAAQQATLEEPTKKWELPIEPNAGSEQEQIDRFRREIIYHGFAFLRRKYSGVSPAQVKWEAARLGLNINWDIVRG